MKGEKYIICRNSDTKGVINFYVTAGSESYFLFQQKFRHSIYEYYKKGIPVRMAFSHKNVHRDTAIENVIKRLPAQLAYAEREYGICILNKSRMQCAA